MAAGVTPSLVQKIAPARTVGPGFVSVSASAGVVYRKTPLGGERTRHAALLVSVVAAAGGVGLGLGLASGATGLGLQLVDARIRHVSDLRHGEKGVAAE